MRRWQLAKQYHNTRKIHAQTITTSCTNGYRLEDVSVWSRETFHLYWPLSDSHVSSIIKSIVYSFLEVSNSLSTSVANSLSNSLANSLANSSVNCSISGAQQLSQQFSVHGVPIQISYLRVVFFTNGGDFFQIWCAHAVPPSQKHLGPGSRTQSKAPRRPNSFAHGQGGTFGNGSPWGQHMTSRELCIERLV